MRNEDRRQEALRVRISAAEVAANRPHPRHVANDDEQKFRTTVQDPCTGSTSEEPSYLASYTKGLPHDHRTGLVANPCDFQRFVLAIDSGDPRDFRDTPLGPEGATNPCDPGWVSKKANSLPKDPKNKAKVRAWESQGAGNTFDLEGPDAQAVTMPPAPAVGSQELTAEMAEVYAQALLRDVPFTLIQQKLTAKELKELETYTCRKVDVPTILAALKKLPWFNQTDCCDLTPAENSRRRTGLNDQTFFRGVTPGDDVGPYISQFMLVGNPGINGNDTQNLKPADGRIAYGAVTVNQRVRFATPCDDHMTRWDEWFDVQNGADLRGQESYDQGYRFITTPRDLATYVHYDALYEAYLNACLLLLGSGVPFDPGIPFQKNDFDDHQQGFAHFGGPHILSLVTEVATRALKAVRFQKFNVHRRARPEVLAARLAQRDKLNVMAPELKEMARTDGMKQILRMVAARNGSDAKTDQNVLLPMAFCEGSPMHPAYGAGHATVAGACVTILKAFFDHKHVWTQRGYVPKPDGSALVQVPRSQATTLTVEGELNKLASNISIGRNWAGVHFFTDYIESIRMGEQIAIGILEEQKLTYGENFSMTVPLYDGGSIRI